MAGSKKTIVLARLEDDFRVVSDAGRDLGRAPKIERFHRPAAVVWLNEGDALDAQKARAFAAKEGYRVFLYPVTEREPLARAKRDVARPLRRKR